MNKYTYIGVYFFVTNTFLKMKARILLLLSLFVFFLQGFGQMYDPISWSIEQKSTSSTTADIIIRAKLEKGWHLYGLNIPPNGPVPTKIVVEQLDNAKKEGGIQAKSKLVEVHDPNFDMKLGWYSDEAVFVQKSHLLIQKRFR